MTTAAGLPIRPVPMVRRSDIRRAVDHFTDSPAVRVVELVLTAGEVTCLVVHWRSGLKTHLAVGYTGPMEPA